jgi:DNA-binding response OmpR family regulator
MILVVDDDESIRAMLVDILSYEGYGVVTARDGMEALAAMDRIAPSLILLDVVMPMLDGRAVADRLREAGSRVPIVLMSASHETVAPAELHADGYITKPFELRTLLATIAKYAGPAASTPPVLTVA